MFTKRYFEQLMIRQLIHYHRLEWYKCRPLDNRKVVKGNYNGYPIPSYSTSSRDCYLEFYYTSRKHV